MKEVHKNKIDAPVNMPLCHKCASRKTIEKLQGYIKFQELVGCQELSDEQWAEGWRADESGLTFQHNCPIIPKINGSKK